MVYMLLMANDFFDEAADGARYFPVGESVQTVADGHKPPGNEIAEIIRSHVLEVKTICMRSMLKRRRMVSWNGSEACDYFGPYCLQLLVVEGE